MSLPPTASRSKATSVTWASCSRECSLSKSDMPSWSSQTASPSMTRDGVRSRLAASTIQGEAIRPVKAAPGEQAHALAVALDDQAVAVVLDLVKPVGAVRNLSSARRDAGFKRRFTHAGKIGEGYENRKVPISKPIANAQRPNVQAEMSRERSRRSLRRSSSSREISWDRYIIAAAPCGGR